MAEWTDAASRTEAESARPRVILPPCAGCGSNSRRIRASLPAPGFIRKVQASPFLALAAGSAGSARSTLPISENPGPLLHHDSRRAPAGGLAVHEVRRLLDPGFKRGFLFRIRTPSGRGPEARLADLLAELLPAAHQVGALDLDLGRERVVVGPAFQLGVGGVVIVLVDAPLLDVGEEGRERVKVALGERVILVVMALGSSPWSSPAR